MKTEIAIASHLKDLPYLVHNLNSIRKFATGFSGVTVIVPSAEVTHFRGAVFDGCKISAYDRHPDSARWQIHAQAQKCLADRHCPDADFILHTDSDCIFTEPVVPEDYFENGKPVMLIESFARLSGNPWKPTVDKALGIDAKYETMRRHPQVNPSWIYSQMRNHIGKLHGMDFEKYVLSQKPSFPWGFSEHCTIGAFALHFYPNSYHWVDVERDVRPKDKLLQFWSHSPPEKHQSTPFGELHTPDAVFRKLGI